MYGIKNRKDKKKWFDNSGFRIIFAVSIFLFITSLIKIAYENIDNQPMAEFIIILSNQGLLVLVPHICATSFNEIYGNSEHYSQGLADSEHGCLESLQCQYIDGGCNGEQWSNVPQPT